MGAEGPEDIFHYAPESALDPNSANFDAQRWTRAMGQLGGIGGGCRGYNSKTSAYMASERMQASSPVDRRHELNELGRLPEDSRKHPLFHSPNGSQSRYGSEGKSADFEEL